MIDKFVSVLRVAKLEPTAEEVADALWLASHAISMAGSQNAESRKTTRANAEAPMRESPSAKSQRRKSSTPSTDTHAGSEAPQGELHQAAGQASSASTNKRGVAMTSPTASALPGALELARALRPLKRRVPSRVHFEVDEEATAQRISERLPDPLVVRPLRTRWLNLALLVDEGPSMPIWQQTVRELQALMGAHGAFGRVKRCGFTADGPSEPHLYARLGRGMRTVGPRELIDPAGRQLVLVVSDCVSRGWHDGRIAEFLGIWARRGPVGLLQVLPPRLWQRSALGAAIPVRLRSDHPAASNVQLSVERNDWWWDDDSTPNTELPFPVFGIERASIEAWTNLIAGRTSNPVGGVLFSGNVGTEDLAESVGDVVSSDARSRVSHFRATSSLKAQKLATYFASAHYLSLPVMRLIQQTMMPDATLGHLAEVFLAGLLHEVTDGNEDPEYVRYYFIEGVRELLLNAAEEESIRRVLTAVSDYTTAHLGHKTSFRAILADSGGDGGEVIPEHEASFARIGAEILRRLGGEYQQIADRIGTRLAPATSSRLYQYAPQASVGGIVGETKLVEFAREYEAIRNHTPSGDARTRRLDRLFDEIKSYAIDARVSTAIALDAFHRSGDGLRIVALAIVDANQDPAGFDMILRAIAESKSAFEQYHGLCVSLQILPRLGLPQKTALRNVIVHQRSGVPGAMIQPESDRWWLSEDLLQQLDAAHQIVLILDITPQILDEQTVEKSLPAKHGHRSVLRLSEFGITPSADISSPDDLKGIENLAERVIDIISGVDLPPHIYLVGRATLPILVYLGRRLPRVEVTVFDDAQLDAGPYLHITPESSADMPGRISSLPKPKVDKERGNFVAVAISINGPIPLERVRNTFAARRGSQGDVLKEVVEIRLDEQLETVGPTVRSTLAAMQLDYGFAKATAHSNRLALFIDGPRMLAFLAGRCLEAFGFHDVVVTDLAVSGVRRAVPDPFVLQVAARIRQLRQERGMSLAELADASDLSRGHLSSVEHGLAAVTPQTIARISKGFNLPPMYLLTFATHSEHEHVVELIRKLPDAEVKKLRRRLAKAVQAAGRDSRPGGRG